MGNVMQAYRDWRFSGDDQFLRDLWPNIKRAIEYAWSSPTSWDPNKDGVMEGRQHNTYDIDFYGPNPMLSGLYLGALKAGQAMAHYLGDEEKAEEYGAIYQSGRRRIESELWNGAHFFQKVEVIEGIEVPANLRAPDSETPMPRHQFGAGCLADQVIGQWEAHVCGLGRILDEKKTKSALAEIYKHNFRRNMREIASVARVYALQDEAGLVLCTWPEGGRPALPFVYSDEVWTGIEYQVAAHMIYEGLVDEGLELVRAARARYDGARRNPWDEIECGHHYARALSSWSLILALSGAQFDGVEKSLTFTPRLAPPLRCFFSTGAAFGVFSRTKDSAEIEILGGQVDLLSFGVDATRETLAEPRRLKPGARWAIALR